MASSSIERAAAVYCRGALLDAVQRARLFDDAKHFVDMPLRRDPEEVLKAFDELSSEDQADPVKLREFVDLHFEPPDAELDPYVFYGWPDEPPFLAAGLVADPALCDFARALHRLWPTLCRVTKPAVAATPWRYSALPRAHPMVLPGGRFRETYYWDSLWIVHGLLACGLADLAKGLVQNLLDDVDHFGFVPNGGRIYYLNRSQPPLLCAMVTAVERALDEAVSKEWLPKAVATLKKEYAYWMGDEHGHAVRLGEFTLNRYNANWDAPRPESYWQDFDTAAGDAKVYRELASVAESGWDFSSRWTRAGGLAEGGAEAFRLKDSQATQVLPTDLNAFLYDFEVTMAELCEAVATGRRPFAQAGGASAPAEGLSDPSAVAFTKAAKQRRLAFDRLFWRPALGRWADVWLPEGFCGGALDEQQVLDGDDAGRRAPNCADFGPALWAGLATSEQAAASIVALQRSGLLGVGGAATTATNTGEQWDAPNGWPPLQGLLIEGLERCGGEPGRTLAADLAQRWVGGCYAAWRATGFMHEKYSTTDFGSGGAGGEYEPQVGFGWSNGGVLQLLVTHGKHLVAPTKD